MNLIDRIVGSVSPQAGLQRLRARAAMDAVAGMGGGWQNGWTAGSKTKRTLKSWLPKLFGAAKQDDGITPGIMASPREIAMGRARDLVRNNPLASGALDTLVSNAVGTGLTLQSRVDWESLKITEEQALEWQRDTEAKFRSWAESPDCDVARTLNFYGLQPLILRTAKESGDAFFLLPTRPARPENPLGLCVQIIEADRVSTPPKTVVQDNSSIIGGVEVDTYGAPVRFWVAEESPADNPNRKFTAYAAFDRKGRRQFFHLMKVKRPGQRRGMSYFAPVLDYFKTLGDYSDAELQAAVISAFFTVFVTSKTGASLPALDWSSEGTGGGSGANTDDDEIKMGPGAVVELPGDTSVSTANPGRPNEKFDPFVQAILRQIGVGLGIPFEVLIKHFTSSYSAARAALLDAWKFFMQERNWVGTNFCQPIYERWLDFMVANGEIQAQGYFDKPEIRKAYRSASWVGDGPGSLDPLKEVQAAEYRLKLGLTDLDEESLAFTGKTYMEKHSRIVKISELRSEAGLLVTGGEIKAPVADPEADSGDDGADTGADGEDTPPAPPQKGKQKAANAVVVQAPISIEMPSPIGTMKRTIIRREGGSFVAETEVVAT